MGRVFCTLYKSVSCKQMNRLLLPRHLTIIGKDFLLVFFFFFALFSLTAIGRIFYILLSLSRCITCYLTAIDKDFLSCLFAVSPPIRQKCSQIYHSSRFGSSFQPGKQTLFGKRVLPPVVYIKLNKQ